MQQPKVSLVGNAKKPLYCNNKKKKDCKNSIIKRVFFLTSKALYLKIKRLQQFLGFSKTGRVIT